MSEQLVVEYTGFKSGTRLIRSDKKLKRALKDKASLFQKVPDEYVFTVLSGQDILKRYFPKYKKYDDFTISKNTLKALLRIAKKTKSFEVVSVVPKEVSVEEKNPPTDI